MPTRPVSSRHAITPGRPFSTIFSPARRVPTFVLGLGAALVASMANPSHADTTNFFFGKWMVDKAVVAPWADPGRKPDEKEMKSFVGKVITFKTAQISGPGILACSGPTYEINEGGADMLFQGALTQKQDGSPQDPTKSAADLGFHGSSIKTLQTGCENELDYHFIDDNTAEFGLNDYVYTIKRQQ